MQDYKKLTIWSKSKALAVQIYKATDDFPRHEKFGITNQMRRAAVSIPSNIAEGAGRKTPRDFSQFLSIAIGSTNELESLMIIAAELEFLSPEEFNELTKIIVDIRKMIYSFQDKLVTAN